MGFFDSVTSTFNRGVAAAGRTGDQVRLKGQMNDANKRRQNLAAQLGASLYDITKDDPNLRLGREALYDGIAAIDAERTQIQAELDRLEREAQAAQIASTHFACPFCGSQLSANDVFCSGCGKPMAEIQAALSSAQTGVPANWGGPTCPKCGAPMNVGDMFCMSCGHKLDAPAAAPSAAPAAEAAPADGFVSEPAPEAVVAPEPAFEPAPESPVAPESVFEPAPESAVAPEPAFEPVAPETAPAGPDLDPSFSASSELASGRACPKCGTPAAPNDKFCMNCGFPL